MKTAVNLTVIGSLYKSGFRFYAQKKGIDLGITGTIAYLGEYGDVFIHAEGDVQAVKDFTAWCEKGLPYCKVQNVEVEEVDPAGFQSFDIIASPTDAEAETTPGPAPKRRKQGFKIFGF